MNREHNTDLHRTHQTPYCPPTVTTIGVEQLRHVMGPARAGSVPPRRKEILSFEEEYGLDY